MRLTVVCIISRVTVTSQYTSLYFILCSLFFFVMCCFQFSSLFMIICRYLILTVSSISRFFNFVTRSLAVSKFYVWFYVYCNRIILIHTSHRYFCSFIVAIWGSWWHRNLLLCFALLVYQQWTRNKTVLQDTWYEWKILQLCPFLSGTFYLFRYYLKST